MGKACFEFNGPIPILAENYPYLSFSYPYLRKNYPYSKNVQDLHVSPLHYVRSIEHRAGAF